MSEITVTEKCGVYWRRSGGTRWYAKEKKPPEIGTVRWIGDGLYYYAGEEIDGVGGNIFTGPYLIFIQEWVPVNPTPKTP